MHNRVCHVRSRFAAVVIVVVAAGALAACGSSAPAQAPSSAATPYVSDPELPTDTYPAESIAPDSGTTASEPVDDQGGGLSELGTFTVHGTGDTVITKVLAATPLPFAQANVPSDVLDSCNWGYTSYESASVYIQGQLRITYTGSVAEPLSIAGGTAYPQVQLLDQAEDTPSDGAVGGVAIQSPDGSEWDDCEAADDETAWDYTLNPNSTTYVNFWAEVPILSNTHPTFTPADQQAIALGFHAVAGDQLTDQSATASVTGPHAASCSDDDYITEPILELLPYATPPHTYRSGSYRGGTDLIHCRPT